MRTGKKFLNESNGPMHPKHLSTEILKKLAKKANGESPKNLKVRKYVELNLYYINSGAPHFKKPSHITLDDCSFISVSNGHYLFNCKASSAPVFQEYKNNLGRH